MAIKMNFETPDQRVKNREAIAKLFPGCINEEVCADGKVKSSVNFDLLRQMLTEDIDEEAQKYEFTWPGKNKSIAEAHRPIRMTLRPEIEKSVDWDHTKNLLIEGDNLAVLKLLQESYLAKIKMIYIDPPYNTGSDLIYQDDFAIDKTEYQESVGLYGDGGVKLFKNTESEGRFHSNWCSMIYPRLLVARNLLSEDGVIFISIDENEQVNLKKICDEIFGETNRVGEIIRKTKSMTGDHGCGFNLQHESLLIYAKSIDHLRLKGEKKEYSGYANPDNDPNGDWCAGDPSAKSGGPSTYFEIENPYTHRKDVPPSGRYWAFSQTTLKRYIEEGKIKFKREYQDKERGFVFKRYKKDATSLFEPVHSLFGVENAYMNQAATIEAHKLFGENVFSYPKPVSFIKKLIQYATDQDSIVMDFFAGSATTAQAVLEQNVEDGGTRTFLMVQIPEEIQKNSTAYAAGYKTICEIARDRIERVGTEFQATGVDVGFRTFRLDDTNMKDIYYAPNDYTQEMLELVETNIKEDRTGLDLLYGCLLEWGLPLSLPHSQEIIEGYIIYNCDDGKLIACFEKEISDAVIRHIASKKPRRVVFCDSSFPDSPTKINARELLQVLSPNTHVKII